MGFPSEEAVRLLVNAILRSAPWTHAFLCFLCLLNLTMEELGPASGMTRMEAGHQGLPGEQCAVCQESGPQVSYTYHDGKAIHLHAACDALWRGECPAP